MGGLVVLLVLGSALTIRPPGVQATESGATSVHVAGGPSGLGCATVDTVGNLSILSPASDSGIVGSYVRLQGSGFVTTGSVFLFFYPPGGAQGREVASVPAGTSEPFQRTVAVPDGSLEDTLGVSEFWALDVASNCASAAFTITAVPPPNLGCVNFGSSELFPSPASGPEGTSVNLVVNGFYPEGATNLWWASPDGSLPVQVGSGDTGMTTWTATVTVPAGYSAGTYLFWGVDGVGDCGGAIFALTASPLVGGTASAGPATIDYSQQASTISPTGVSGGTPPYAYTWYLDTVDTGTCGSSSTETALGIGPTWTTGSEITGPGTYYYCYVVTDSASASQPSGYATVTVDPTLSPPVIAAAPGTVDQGQTVTLTTTAPFGGGTSPYACQWLDETPSGSGWVDLLTSFACAPGSLPGTTFSGTADPGAYAFELQVTDTLDTVVTSNSAAVTVASALVPTVTVALSPAAISLHESTFVSVVVTGTGPTPTGSVSVSDGLTEPGDSCTIPSLNGSGGGSCELQPSHVGALTVTATYSGDATYASEPGAASLTVTGIDLTMSPTSGSQGQTLNVVLGGFSPVASGTNASFGNAESGIQVDSVTISGLSSITVQITIALNATLQGNGVIVTVSSPWGEQSIEFGSFRVTTLHLTITPASGTQDETLDVVLAGFTPPPASSLQSPLRVTFGRLNAKVHVDAVTMTGLSNLTVQITIGRHARIQADPVAISWLTGNSTHRVVHSLDFGNFRVLAFAVTMSSRAGTQDETMDLYLGGFTVSPMARDMSVTFGKPTSGITMDSVALAGLSSLLVEITIADNAKTGPVAIQIAESVPGGPNTSTSLTLMGFHVLKFAVTLSPSSGSQGETLVVALTGFTVAPSASDMTVTFGNANSMVAVNSVLIAGPSSIQVSITIAGNAPVGSDPVTVVESVSGGANTFTTIHAGSFAVTA